MDAPKPTRRWLSFSLRTLFVAVTVCGAAGYWLAKEADFRCAKMDYDNAAAAWAADAITTADLCKSSEQLFRAEVSVPFSRRSTAAGAHLARIEVIRTLVHAIADQALFGKSESPSKMRAEVAGYYAEAERLVAQNR